MFFPFFPPFIFHFCKQVSCVCAQGQVGELRPLGVQWPCDGNYSEAEDPHHHPKHHQKSSLGTERVKRYSEHHGKRRRWKHWGQLCQILLLHLKVFSLPRWSPKMCEASRWSWGRRFLGKWRAGSWKLWILAKRKKRHLNVPPWHSVRRADISFIKRLRAAPLIMHERIMQF